MSDPFSVRLVCWRDEAALLQAIRTEVFIREQGVPVELEWDGVDEHCRHALALSPAGDAIGCGRILPDGHIGRIAVLSTWRKQKIGTALMDALIYFARTNAYMQVELHAQTHALAFYHRFNFVEQGETFMEAGLPHIKMSLRL